MGCGASTAAAAAAAGNLTYFVWNTDRNGPLYMYQNPDGVWHGAYIRKDASNSGSIGKDLFSGQFTLGKTVLQGGELEGAYTEPSGEKGTVKVNQKDLNAGKFTASYKPEGGDSKEWKQNGDSALEKDSAVATSSSLFPFQVRWVESFNKQDHDTCANLYTEDAIFSAYNFAPKKKGQEKNFVAVGREKIREWWNGAINGDFKLRNLGVKGRLSSVLSPNEVAVHYDNVTFGNETDPTGNEAFQGRIDVEQWVRSTTDGGWYVLRDIITAGVKLPEEEPASRALTEDVSI